MCFRKRPSFFSNTYGLRRGRRGGLAMGDWATDTVKERSSRRKNGPLPFLPLRRADTSWSTNLDKWQQPGDSQTEESTLCKTHANQLESVGHAFSTSNPQRVCSPKQTTIMETNQTFRPRQSDAQHKKNGTEKKGRLQHCSQKMHARLLRVSSTREGTYTGSRKDAEQASRKPLPPKTSSHPILGQSI